MFYLLTSILLSKIFEHLNKYNIALAKQAALVTADLGLIELICRGYFMVKEWRSFNIENRELFLQNQNSQTDQLKHYVHQCICTLFFKKLIF